MGKSRAALWTGTILPTIGGAFGIYRFFVLHSNPFSIFHVLLDLVVIPCCIFLLVRGEKVPN
jgi:hypothetical protein